MSPDTQDNQATERYLQLIKTLHDDWDRLDALHDTSVRPSNVVLDTVMESVRANTRHGAAVQVPPTEHGPYTLTELALRTLVRHAVDSVPHASALQSSFDYADASAGHRGRGQPVRIHCRISAHIAAPRLPELAQQVRDTVRSACQNNLNIAPDVDVCIEDLHDDDF